MSYSAIEGFVLERESMRAEYLSRPVVPRSRKWSDRSSRARAAWLATLSRDERVRALVDRLPTPAEFRSAWEGLYG